MPPSQYLGYSWPAWCETDCLLDRAISEYEQRLCGCGCGFWSSETRGEDFDGEFKAVEVVCNARAAIDLHRKETKKPTPGALVWAARKTDDDD